MSPSARVEGPLEIETPEGSGHRSGAKLALEERLSKPALKGLIKHKSQNEIEREKKIMEKINLQEKTKKPNICVTGVPGNIFLIEKSLRNFQI